MGSSWWIATTEVRMSTWKHHILTLPYTCSTGRQGSTSDLWTVVITAPAVVTDSDAAPVR